MITREHTQEALSLAYVHALARRAGLNLGPRSTFDYGIDGTFVHVKQHEGALIETGFMVRFQMKATCRWDFDGDDVVYDLSARAHRILASREEGEVMAILILLCLPEDDTEWLVNSETELNLRHCCYWYRVPGPPTENESTQRIRIPRANVLTPEALKSIMALGRRVARGEA